MKTICSHSQVPVGGWLFSFYDGVLTRVGRKVDKLTAAIKSKDAALFALTTSRGKNQYWNHTANDCKLLFGFFETE